MQLYFFHVRGEELFGISRLSFYPLSLPAFGTDGACLPTGVYEGMWMAVFVPVRDLMGPSSNSDSCTIEEETRVGQYVKLGPAQHDSDIARYLKPSVSLING